MIYAKFCTKSHDEGAYSLYPTHLKKSAGTNMATIRYFEVRSDILNVYRIYMNTKYQSKHNHLLYNYYLWATCFDSLESSSGPTKNRSKVI